MTPVEKHAASQANSDLASTTLMGWVSRAKILLDGGKLDAENVARNAAIYRAATASK